MRRLITLWVENPVLVFLITGSFNFTKAAEEKNAENLLILKNKELAKIYIDNWNRHRKHSGKYMGRK